MNGIDHPCAEATLLHTGMSWMTRGFSHVSRLGKKKNDAKRTKKKGEGGGAGDGHGALVARAIVGCWSNLTWSISGATLNPLVDGALRARRVHSHHA